jgi:hypothetical protein
MALMANTSGNCNTAVGTCTLRCNTTGFDNTAVGHNSLFCSTIGSFNTAVGRCAGASITTGGCNVVIGGFTAAAQATQNCNIFLSDGAGNLRMTITGSSGHTSFLYPVSASATTASQADFFGTASWALGVVGGGGTAFPFTGKAEITGSLNVTGSTSIIGNTIITGSLIVSGANGAGVFSKGGSIADFVSGISSSGSYAVWRAPFPATVVALHGHKVAAGTVNVNAQRRTSAGVLTQHLATPLAVATSNTWTSASLANLLNTDYSIGDTLLIVISGSAMTSSAVQVDFIKR